MSGVAFIVGAPRSGTTILGEILDLHPELASWYEPIFVFDRFFQDEPDDRRTAEQATKEVKTYIEREFAYFAAHSNNRLVVDKTPFHSFKLPFLNTIFPDARFIHLLRDGRDVALSMRVEWKKRTELVNRKNDIAGSIQALRRYLDRQPLLKHKIEAVQFEIGSPANLVKGIKSISYRTRRWRGHTGWGPQFEGWQEKIDRVSMLQFNAMQWEGCVKTILEDQPTIDPKRFLEIRYEQLLQDPHQTLSQVFDFLKVSPLQDLLNHIPPLKRENFNKWISAFSAEEKQEIGPILTPLLVRTGYAENDTWFTANG